MKGKGTGSENKRQGNTISGASQNVGTFKVRRYYEEERRSNLLIEL
jgi:hypothetical protein